MVSELDAMKAIDEALSGITDPPTRDRILKWAWAKFSPIPPVPIDSSTETSPSINIPQKKKTSKKIAKPKSTPTLVKDLNLKPSGKKSFEEFAKEKSPSSDPEKCTVCVYYLINELNQSPLSVNHVFTCFKNIGWRVPADIESTLYWTASQKGWLDTSNMSDIKVSISGSNLIEHDLPRKGKETK